MLPWRAYPSIARKSRYLWVALGGLLAAQVAASASPLTTNSQLSPAVVARFKAAEAAQNRKDFRAAERDYRAIIQAAPRFAPAYLNLGLIYQAEVRRADAVKLFETAVSLDPGLFGAQFFLGLNECARGQPQPAISHLKAALRLRPDYAQVYAWLSTAQTMAGDLDGAIKTLQQGLLSNHANTDLLYLSGRSYEALGREAIDQLQKSDPHSSYVEQWLAEDYAQSGYAAAALVHFENAISAAPKRKRLHLELGEVYLGAGNLARALAEFKTELQIDRFSLAARVRQGEVELLEGELSAAIDDWGQALARDPSRVHRLLDPRSSSVTADQGGQLPASLVPDLKAARAQVRKLHGAAADLAIAFTSAQEGRSFSQAALADSVSPQTPRNQACTPPRLVEWLREDRVSWVVSCRNALAKVPLKADLFAELVRDLVIEGYPREALQALNQASVQNQAIPSLSYWRARCYKALAVRAYSQLVTRAPDSDRAHELLGNIAMARHQDATAIREYREALGQNPELPDLHYEIGHLLWKNFKVSEARQEFGSELRLNPRHIGALLDLGGTYLYEHHPAQALPFLNRAENLEPANTTAHEFLGVAYFQLGRYASALAELQKAAPSDKDGHVHYQLGKVLQAMNRKSDAQKEFAAATAITLRMHRENEVRVNRLNTAESLLQEE